MSIDSWNAKLKEYHYDALKKIQAIVAIPSFLGEPKEDAPYGEAIQKVLYYALELEDELGFKTHIDTEKRYGYLEYGEWKEIFAILCHLDVVPPGDLSKWDIPPFKPEIRDGKLFGRGVIDDKGPTIINMYALKYLKDHNIKPKYRIRLIFGLAEETDWDSINAYKKKEEIPTLGYTPDGQFPVVYAEKGIINADIIGTGEPFTLIGGEAYNAVLDLVRYQGPHLNEIKAKLEQKDIHVTMEKDWLVVKGTSAHGSFPERGFNAALVTLATYAEIDDNSPIANFVKKHLYNNFHFSHIYPKMKGESGLLIVNNGIVDINKDKTRLTLNMRVPITYKLADVQQPLEAELKGYNLKLTVGLWQEPLHVPTDDPMIKTMMKIYKEATGDTNAKPFAIGGGTYAKAIPKCVAFGAEFDITKSTMHSYNKYVELHDLEKMLEIYVLTLLSLTR